MTSYYRLKSKPTMPLVFLCPENYKYGRKLTPALIKCHFCSKQHSANNNKSLLTSSSKFLYNNYRSHTHKKMTINIGKNNNNNNATRKKLRHYAFPIKLIGIYLYYARSQSMLCSKNLSFQMNMNEKLV